ncbi:MAG: hypothetical protein P8182_03270 [Deltaproteobacteria bacterium]
MDRTRWASSVPLVRPEPGAEIPDSLTYRVYLESIERIIVERIDLLRAAMIEQGAADNTRIDEIGIIAEKHGSDYHPARVRVCTPDGPFSFVMNVAATERGAERLVNEFHLLRRLARNFRPRYVPRAYFLAADPGVREHGYGMGMTMFLGEWFEGYHEFHPSSRGDGEPARTVLWDTSAGYRDLSHEEVRESFRQAAFILTFYYDPSTFKEIFPWHHAAGDFVVRRLAGGVDVKLITVRQYAARATFEAESPHKPVTALLFFLANLSIRMRLDRLDGIGEIVWAEDHCVEAAVHGFFAAMEAKGAAANRILGEFQSKVRDMSPAELAEVCRVVIDSYHPDAPDLHEGTSYGLKIRRSAGRDCSDCGDRAARSKESNVAKTIPPPGKALQRVTVGHTFHRPRTRLE